MSYARGCDVRRRDRSGFAEAVALARGRRRRRGGARRPGRAVRAGHLRRGLRRHRPAAARGAGGAAAELLADRHAGRARADHRAARTRSAPWPAAWPRSCRRSSPARRAAARSPGSCPAGSAPSGKPAGGAAGRAGRPAVRPTWRPPLGRPARGELGRPDAAVRLRARAVVHHVRLLGPVHAAARRDRHPRRAGRRRHRHRRRGRDLVHGPQRRRPGRRPRSSSCTCATRSRRSPGPSAGWRASPGCARSPARPAGSTSGLHADRTSFHGRGGGRIVEPGEIRVGIGGASDRLPLRGSFRLHGAERAVGADRVLDTPVVIRAAPRARASLA